MKRCRIATVAAVGLATIAVVGCRSTERDGEWKATPIADGASISESSEPSADADQFPQDLMDARTTSNPNSRQGNRSTSKAVLARTVWGGWGGGGNGSPRVAAQATPQSKRHRTIRPKPTPAPAPAPQFRYPHPFGN